MKIDAKGKWRILLAATLSLPLSFLANRLLDYLTSAMPESPWLAKILVLIAYVTAMTYCVIRPIFRSSDHNWR